MGMGLTSNGGLKPVINVTPLIDVLLVLLIIFLMIQPQHQHGLEAQVPQPPTSPNSTPPLERTVVLELFFQKGEKPKLMINQAAVSWEELQVRLEGIYKTRAEKIMFIKGEDQLSFADVAAVIDVAREADRDLRVGLITRDLQHGD
jgi:biopolymer transport protein ExbD